MGEITPKNEGTVGSHGKNINKHRDIPWIILSSQGPNIA